MTCHKMVTIQGKEVLKTDDCTHLDQYHYNKPSGGHFRGGAYCGHGSAHIKTTNSKDHVTCLNCIDMFPENLYK